VVLFSYFFLPSEIFILNGYQLLWLSCIIIPILCASTLFTAKEKDLMTTMPTKNILDSERVRQRIGAVGVRIMLSAATVLFLFIW
jgi:hypothetical protein